MKIYTRIAGLAMSFVMLIGQTALSANADADIAHDPSRDVQTEGVGNPFNYGERNTPADASTEEIRKMIGADSLGYMKLEDLEKTVGYLNVCKACFDGKYPTKINRG